MASDAAAPEKPVEGNGARDAEIRFSPNRPAARVAARGVWPIQICGTACLGNLVDVNLPGRLQDPEKFRPDVRRALEVDETFR